VSYDERQLGELLRLLRPAPEALVERAKELPLHFDDVDDGWDDADDDGDSGGTPPYGDDSPSPEHPDPDHDNLLDDDDDSPGDEWG
jgi:hypothetical protein